MKKNIQKLTGLQQNQEQMSGEYFIMFVTKDQMEIEQGARFIFLKTLDIL